MSLLLARLGLILCFASLPAMNANAIGKEREAADRPPTPVQIGIKVDQIVGINQKEENFGAVATILARYRDPALAYEAAPGALPFRMFRLADFLTYVQAAKTHWPSTILDNQQGRMDTSVELVALAPDGDVRYLRRFSTTFQAPNFDFRRFPFDEQEFHIDATLVLPKDAYVFEEMPGLSGMGDALGEEEWVVSDVSTQVSTVTGETGLENSRFSLAFRAHRHLTYYIARIFIPVFIILTVSWFTFLLRDYVKRVDVGITNLLLFIAFNFAVSSDLPRLGYITLMDAFMTGTFVITGIVLLVNVVFRRLQTIGREELAARLDRYAIWGYWPAYVLGMSLALFWL